MLSANKKIEQSSEKVEKPIPVPPGQAGLF